MKYKSRGKIWPLRRLYNYWGSLNGYGGCRICGDSWYWKKHHSIWTGESGIFPYCEECHETASQEEKHTAITALGNLWASQLPLEEGEHMALNAAHQAVNDHV